MNLMALVFSQGWASGVNAYLVVLLLGISDRYGDFDQIPDVLANTWVLVSAGTLYAIEFVADKIPYVDSTWDAISTAIRPTVGAVIALLVSGDATSLEQAIYATVGGGTALASHLVKAGLRAAVNTEEVAVRGAYVAEFGREHHLIPAVGDGFADEFLVGEGAVHVRRIDKGNAELYGAVDGGDGLILVACAVELAHTHTAEADLRHLKALAA